MIDECNNCIYFMDAEKGYGICRKNPPIKMIDRIVHDINSEAARIFSQPVVHGEDWCGKWRDK